MVSPHSWWSAAADLLVGADCAGCGAPGLDWCGSCAQACRPAPRLIDGAGDPVGVAAAENAGALSRVLIGWKDRGRHRLGEAVGHLLACSVLTVVAGAEGRCALVPVPTARSQVRRRGGDPVLAMTGTAARVLATVGVDADVAPILTRSRRTRDQVGLSLEERRGNLAGAFVAVPDAIGRLARTSSGAWPVTRVVVVDDIWTTGTSARESVRALAVAGVRVDGVAVVAATPLGRDA